MKKLGSCHKLSRESGQVKPKVVNIFVQSKVLIFDAELTNPPTSLFCFRNLLTFLSLKKSYSDFLLETTSDQKDIYWHWIKNYYLTDYIKEIVVFEEKTKGVRVSQVIIEPPTFMVEKITFENFWEIYNAL